MSFPLRAVLVSSSVCIGLLTTGCGVSTVSNSTPSAHAVVINGRVHGGQQPITGSSIQLYAASETVFQGASAPLLTTPVTTDALGNFNITGDYTCPAANPLVYIVATGGNPGLPGSQTNPGIAEMSVLGSCNDLVANAASTFIFIDELTTVVAVQALAPFMTDYAHIGSAPSSISGVAGAFQTAASEIDFTTGQFSYAGTSLDLPYLNLNTVADIIAACVNTAGGSSSCSTLYSNTGGASDTIGATLAIAKAPGQNASQLYSLISSSAPFQPYFATVPSDYTSTVGFTFPNFVQTGALDSNGRLWLYFGGYNYDTGSDTSTASPGYIQVYDNNFNPLFTVQPGTGGLYYPSDMAADASGHVFATNSNNTVSEFDSNGNAISPSAGWNTGIASTFSPSQAGNGQPYNPSQVGPIGVDAQGNIWGAIPDDSGPGQNNCYFEMNSAGTVITPSGNFCGTSGNYSGVDALDGSGNAWAYGTSSIGKVNALGNLAATAPTQQGCFYTYDNISGMPNPQQNYESTTSAVGYDHVHNQLWGYSETGAGAITDAGASLFCNFGSTSLPVAQQTSTGSAAPGTSFSGGSVLITNAVLDGGGNLWFATGRSAQSGVVGSTMDTFTGTATYSSYLSELSPSGSLATPYNAANGTYGLQPTGFGANVSSTTGTDASVYTYGISAALLGVDRFGNIWAEDIQSKKLLKITGMAVPNTVNY